MDVDVPARRRWGLIDILDDRGRLGRASRRGHQIVEWVLDRTLRVTRAEVAPARNNLDFDSSVRARGMMTRSGRNARLDRV